MKPANRYFFLDSLSRDDSPIWSIVTILVNCPILKIVATSVAKAKAKLGTLFLNTQEAKVICIVFHELGHPQPTTPIHIDNTTTVSVVNNTIKKQKSRSVEM